jgi:prepilin-type N-terminal cleavage/methylation domain-containing protein
MIKNNNNITAHCHFDRSDAKHRGAETRSEAQSPEGKSIKINRFLGSLCSLGMTRRRLRGLTLPEMTVVIAIAALMVALTIPAANMLLNSFESESGAKSIISAALASARSIALKEQRYAGIRFQKRYDPNNPDPLNASQYIIFIIKGENRQVTGNLTNGFRAVDGIQPIKLPDSIGVMDMTLVQRTYLGNYQVTYTENSINGNSLIDETSEVGDTTAFSIIFSPSGKLVIHEVQTRNRDGCPDTSTNTETSDDDIFNKKVKADAGLSMFYQDDYGGAWWSPWVGFNVGLGPESSRNSFVIYDTKKLKQVPYNNRWDGYLKQIAQNPVYINPYTGTIVNEK